MTASTAPYRDVSKIKAEISAFMKRNASFFGSQGTKVSDFFEMTCFNDVVRYYTERKFKAAPMQLGPGREFIYKLTPSGLPMNFSYFKIEHSSKKGTVAFEVHHNLGCESAHQERVFYTPDVSVIRMDSIRVVDGADSIYCGNRRVANVAAPDLLTFVEVKHKTPFPELLFSFTGLITELMPDALAPPGPRTLPRHLAPTLAISGRGNPHTNRIIESLQSRYQINIIDQLFYKTSGLYSKKHAKNTVGTK